MTQEQKIASTEPASVVEPVSPVVETPKPEATTPQSLTEERVQQMIAEATKKATQEALEMGKNLGKREMQAIKDREVAQVKRQTDILDRRVKAYESGFSDLDEDTRSKLEARSLRSENDAFKTQQQEEENRRQQEANYERMNQSIKDEVVTLGLDPTDTRIDYATDAKDYFEGRKRFTESVAKIVKSEKDNLEKSVLQKAEDKNKQFEAELRKKYGLDSQDTTASMGVVNKSDAEFMHDWGAYTLPDTKENRARYEEIKKKNY